MYPEATDDTDAGLVDCDFVSSPFLPCGVREVDALSVTMIASIEEQKVGRDPRSIFRQLAVFLKI